MSGTGYAPCTLELLCMHIGLPRVDRTGQMSCSYDLRDGHLSQDHKVYNGQAGWLLIV